MFSTCSADFLTFVLESCARRRRRARFSLAAFKENVSSSYKTQDAVPVHVLLWFQTRRWGFVCLTVGAEAVRAADLHSPEWQSAVSFLSLLTSWNTKSNLLRTLQTKCTVVKSGLGNKVSQSVLFSLCCLTIWSHFFLDSLSFLLQLSYSSWLTQLNFESR